MYFDVVVVVVVFVCNYLSFFGLPYRVYMLEASYLSLFLFAVVVVVIYQKQQQQQQQKHIKKHKIEKKIR